MPAAGSVSAPARASYSSQLMRTSFLLATAASSAVALGCSSGSASSSPGDDGGPTCSEDAGQTGSCTPYVSCADLTTPTVSFSKDVLPVFNNSCGIGGQQCHGDPMVGHTGQPYLGQSPGTPDVAAILAGIVGQPAEEDTQFSLVAAGDPAKSYLMHKVDGDACRYAKECNATGDPLFKNCGSQMPFNAGSLSLAQRDTIRRWIAQGAKND
jgi:hypothetical protein